MCYEDPSIDTEQVTTWFVQNIDRVRPPLRFHRITGGNSNITIRVIDAESKRYVLRRPPVNNVLNTAHDMWREYRIITALASSSVPVPQALGFCHDGRVTGAPFYVMAFVEGRVLDNPHSVHGYLNETARIRVAHSLVDTLAELHAVGPANVGLEDLGKKGAYVQRQLRRWLEQIDHIATPRLGRLRETHDALADKVPEQHYVGIVHGDFRLGNCITTRDGSIAGVLDWELCTLGDPLADVGYLLMDWETVGTVNPVNPNSPTLAEGFPGSHVALQRYHEHSRRDLSEIDFYIAFSAWRRACILEGVYARLMSDATQEAPSDIQGYVPWIARCLDNADDVLRHLH